MAAARGFRTRAALAREPQVTARAWPAATPAACSVLLPLLTETLRERPQRLQGATPHTGIVPSAPALVATPVSGDYVLLATYNGLETVWALALGHQAKRYGGTVFPQTLAPGVYQHRFEVDRRLDSHAWEAGESGFRAGDSLTAGQQKLRRATAVVDKQIAAWETTSCMVGSLSVEGGPNGCTLSLGLVGHALSRASATNPHLDSATVPTFQPLAWSHLVARVRAYSAGTSLSGSDVQGLSGLQLSLDNRLSARPSTRSGLAIDEPRKSGATVVQGQFVLPRYQAETWLDWAANQTVLMADLVWTGPLIPGTATAYKLSLYLPSLTLLETSADTQGAGRHQLAVPFVAHAAAGSAAGFPTATKSGPLLVEVVSDQSTNPLL